VRNSRQFFPKMNEKSLLIEQIKTNSVFFKNMYQSYLFKLFSFPKIMFILLYLMNPLSPGELFVVNVCCIMLTGCIW